jgi:ABC-type sugar transport system substrate-binding protein/DNA-binding response OmpR family regulator/nitrogen-specific signal transduction histidine kinase
MRIVHIFFVIVLVILLIGCKSNNSKHEYVIGVSQCSDDAWRRTMNNEMRLEASFYNNVKLIIKTAHDNNKRQIQDIQSFIDQKVDAIIVAPNEAQPITPIVEKAYQAGIPVILVDRKIASNHYTSFVGANNYLIGQEVGRYAANILKGKGNIVEIRGLNGSTPAEERHNGFINIVSKYPQIKIIFSQDGAWVRETAKQKMQQALKLSNINLVFAHNDQMAIGAYEATKQDNKESGIKFLGIDALPGSAGGVEQVIKGVLDATFLYPTGGEKAIQTALAILRHQPYKKEYILYTAAVDKNNARILKFQNEQITEHQSRIEQISVLLNKNLEKYATQRTLLSSLFLILLLTLLILFISIRAYKAKTKTNKALEQKNIAIENQRNKLSIQHEQLLALSKNLQEATQEKLTFFTNVSHEFRTPLTLLIGPIDTLLSRDHLHSEERKLLLLMRRNANILLKLVGQIIDFRKYESGKLQLNLTLSNFQSFLSDLSTSFDEYAKRKHIHFHFSSTHDDFTMWFDNEKIETIYFNLLSNAFKFTSENGHIHVKLHKEHINGSDFAIISVSDDGKNIPLEHIENIFNRFYKVDPHTPGSGIGLALTKALVDSHNGNIWVESGNKNGCTFKVQLPFLHNEIPLVEQQPVYQKIAIENIEAPVIPELDLEIENNQMEESIPFENDKPLILIVEDNADVRFYTKSLLTDNYTIIEAGDGQNGLNKAIKYVPELIISDVMMPGMNGYELCKQLKENLSTSHIPVMLLTACTLDEQRAAGFESGADAYIQKPFNDSLLMIRVRKLIENRQRVKEYFEKNLTFGESKSNVASIDKAFINKFHKLIEENLSDSELNVDDIGKNLGLSRIQLYRKIKSLTNYAPNELVRIIRLKAGADLLVRSEKNISEIAYEVGFTSPSYFTKCFREYFNESPSDYEKKFKTV